MKKIKTPKTPLPFVAMLQDYKTSNGFSNTQVAQEISLLTGSNVSAAQSSISLWLRGAGSPGNVYRPALAKLLGHSEQELFAEAPSSQQGLGPARAARAQTQKQNVEKRSRAELIKPPAATEVLSFAARSDGTMTVKLHVTLDARAGLQLMQQLLEFGLVPETGQAAGLASTITRRSITDHGERDRTEGPSQGRDDDA